MIKEGVLEKVEAIFGLHLVLSSDSGVVASRSDDFLAGCGFFRAVIHAKGGHAVIPQDSVIDPILVVSYTSIKNNKKKIEEEEGTAWDIQEKTTEPPPLLQIAAAGSSLLLLRFVEPKGQPPPFCDRLATIENRHNFLLHSSSSSVRTHQLRRPSDSSCRTPSNTNTTIFATCLGFW
ncbi:unnamed protein product [Lactuca virosa]|uniref:Peptidase M20 dimerisation domain-containing protein n=1 Tax=Lactuca virosa TaxID=75947 RepID=A0AAU9PDQ8_9ASTR|nr:unnamed protein product [Lactuca virosa]